MRLPTQSSLRLAALAVLTTLGACSIDSPTDPLTGRASLARRPKPTTSHDPILFVHGWNASSSTWTTMVGRFKKDGWTNAELVNWSYNPNQSNATTAELIRLKVDSILAVTQAAHVDIITHSMGSLSARYYMKVLGGDGKVDALVTLAGPDHGTNTAWFCGSTACIEMRPSSDFLDNLNAGDETPGSPRYATWYSPCDEVINPQSSSILIGSTVTQTACMNHSQLHEDAGVYREVRDWVKTTPVLAALP